MKTAHVGATIHWCDALGAIEEIVDRDLEQCPDRWGITDVERLEAVARKIREHLDANGHPNPSYVGLQLRAKG